MDIEAASSDYVLEMDIDVKVKEDTIRLLKSALEESADIALVAPAVSTTHILSRRLVKTGLDV